MLQRSKTIWSSVRLRIPTEFFRARDSGEQSRPSTPSVGDSKRSSPSFSSSFSSCCREYRFACSGKDDRASSSRSSSSSPFGRLAARLRVATPSRRFVPLVCIAHKVARPRRSPKKSLPKPHQPRRAALRRVKRAKDQSQRAQRRRRRRAQAQLRAALESPGHVPGARTDRSTE